jgi:ABC-type uncharacterized transport system fused permease/ATPase subunit
MTGSKPPIEAPKRSGRQNKRGLNETGKGPFDRTELLVLYKLAQVDPELAAKIIDQRDNDSARAAASYRFGLFVSISSMLISLISLLLVLLFSSIAKALVLVLGVMAIALLTRVVITGDWSETGWFGKGLELILQVFGKTTKG